MRKNTSQACVSTFTALAYFASMMASCDAQRSSDTPNGAALPSTDVAKQALLPVPTDATYQNAPTDIITGFETVGETPFSYSVSDDGAAQLSIPIWVPPGRQGLQPSLALTYSSRSGNGPVGVGWQLAGLSSIARCRRTPAQDGAFGGAEPDRLCLDGARLVPVTPETTGLTVEYRTEVDSFRKVVGHRSAATAEFDSFVVYEPSGLKLKYASRMADSSFARVEGATKSCFYGGVNDPYNTWMREDYSETHYCISGGQKRRAWLVDEVEDRFKNVMWIDYLDAERLLPSLIRYTSSRHPGTPETPKKSVAFEYELRDDKRTLSMAGVAYTASRRLKTVTVTGPKKLAHSNFATATGTLRKYQLQYSTHPITLQSSLTQVTECSGEAQAVCKPPLRFSYTGASGVQFEAPIQVLSGAPIVAAQYRGFKVADFDGDGRDDVLHRNALGQWRYRFSNGQALGNEVDPGFQNYDDGALGLGLVNLNRDQTADGLVPTGAGLYGLAQRLPTGAFSVAYLPPTTLQPGDHAPYTKVLGLGDLNGDGLPDLVARHHCRTSGTPGANGTISWCRWAFAANSSAGTTLQVDSATDFKTSAQPCTGAPTVPPAPPPPLDACVEGAAVFGNTEPGGPAYVVDVDGNGVNEAVVSARNTPGQSQTSRPPGIGLELKALHVPTGTAASVARTGLTSLQAPRLFLDLNGDGLSDSLRVSGGKLWVALNVGGSFDNAVEAPLSAGLAATDAISQANELRVGDFNSDGLEDLFLPSLSVALLSDGMGRFVERTLAVPVGADSRDNANQPESYRRQWDQTIDFNGDGLVDFLQKSGNDTHTQVVLQRGPLPGLLEGVEGGALTSQVKLVYKPSSAPDVHTAGACTGPQFCLRKGSWLVGELKVKADAPAPNDYNRQLHTYVAGRFDIKGRGWLGFEKHVVTDEQTGVKLTRTFDNLTPRAHQTTAGVYLYPGAFRPSEELVEWDDRVNPDTAGHKRQQKTLYAYEESFVGPTARNLLASVARTDSEASAMGLAVGPFVALASRRTIFTHDPYGLVTEERSIAFEGAFDASGEPPASASVKRVTLTRVPSQPDLQEWLVRRFDRTTVWSREPSRPNQSAQEQTRTTDFEWVPGTMSLSRIVVEPSVSMLEDFVKSDTRFFRESPSASSSNGNVTRIEMRAGDLSAPARTTTLGWDSLDGTFQSSVTNPKLQVSTLYYHAAFGQLAVSDDPNDNRTSVRFDGFGRVKVVDVPSLADVDTRYSLNPEGLLEIVTEQAGAGKQVQLVDRWGRLTRSEETRHGSAMAIVKSTYTRNNQLATRSLPFYSNEKPEYFAFTYDKIGRLVQRSAPELDEVSWAYEGLTTSSTDARQVKRATTVDALGRLTRSVVFDGTRPVESLYEYGPFNVLDAVQGPLGQRTQLSHDRLGRRTAMSDPSTGTSTMRYSGFGELLWTSDGAGTREYERDALGRVTKLLVGGVETESFVWDTALQGVGLLAEATMSPGPAADQIKVAYEYGGGHSRPSTETTTVGTGGPSYELKTTWDDFDRPILQWYPGVGTQRLTVALDYDTSGTLVDVKSGATGESFWHLTKQRASGAPEVVEYGRGITTRRSFDREARLTFVETSQPGVGSAPALLLQRLKYEYGPGGLLKSRQDVPDDFNGRTTEDFEHDFMGRLSKWTVYQSCWKSEERFTYDDVGNLTRREPAVGAGRNVVNTYGPTAASPNAGPHAISAALEAGVTNVFLYDSAGRQTSVASGGRTVDWSYFNLPNRITQGAWSVDFKYDALHRRTVKQRAVGDSTTYVGGGVYERHATLSATKHRFALPFGIGEVEWVESGGVVTSQRTAFFHPDALGSPDAVSTQAGTTTQLQERVKFEPFGERRHPGGLAYPVMVPSRRTQGFTGHEPDDEFGLINMRGRIYDSRTSRFLTPDPYVQAPQFSQSLNRYTYVFNSPVNLVDPSGFVGEGWGGSIHQGSGGANGSGSNAGPGGSGNPGGGGPALSPGSSLLCGLAPGLCGGGSSGGGGDTAAYSPSIAQDTSRRAAAAGPGGGGVPANGGLVPLNTVEGGYLGQVSGFNREITENPDAVDPAKDSALSDWAFDVQDPAVNVLSHGVRWSAGVVDPLGVVEGKMDQADANRGADTSGGETARIVRMSAGIALGGAGSLSRAEGAMVRGGTKAAKGARAKIPWSSKTVKSAAESLESGAKLVTVGSRAEAEELFLRQFQGAGYRNTTGWSPKQAKEFFGEKAGSYHWDVGAGAYPHGQNHLQVHTHGGDIIRIFFP